MKKIISAALLVAMGFIVGCGEETKKTTTTETHSSTSTATPAKTT